MVDLIREKLKPGNAKVVKKNFLSLFLSIDPHPLRVGDKLQTETVRAPSNSFSITLAQSTPLSHL